MNLCIERTLCTQKKLQRKTCAREILRCEEQALPQYQIFSSSARQSFLKWQQYQIQTIINQILEPQAFFCPFRSPHIDPIYISFSICLLFWPLSILTSHPVRDSEKGWKTKQLHQVQYALQALSLSRTTDFCNTAFAYSKYCISYPLHQLSLTWPLPDVLKLQLLGVLA